MKATALVKAASTSAALRLDYFHAVPFKFNDNLGTSTIKYVK